MSGSETSSSNKALWASTTPLTGTTGRSAGTPRKHTRVVKAPALRQVRCRLAAVLLVVGAALQVGAVFPRYGLVTELFPTFLATANLGDGSGAVLQQVLPAIPLLIAAALLFTGRRRVVRAGFALGAGAVGLTVATGLFPLAQLLHYGAHIAGPGLWLSVGGSLLGLVAMGIAYGELDHAWLLGHFSLPTPMTLVVAVAAGAAVIVGYIPGWLVYHVNVTTLGNQTLQLPGAFDNNRWPVMTAEVIALVVITATVLLAIAWQPGRARATVLLGMAAPIIGRLAATAVRTIDGLKAKDLGLTASQVQRLDVGLDKWVWVETGGLIALGLLALFLALYPSDRSAADEG